MHPCKFPLAPTILAKKNENLDIKINNNQYSFILGGINFKSIENPDNIKCRITLQHKITGETKYFYDTDEITFIPDIAKLNAKESGSNIAASYADLTREFGSNKAKKQLRENEKLSINKEAQKTLKDAQRDALKDEKIGALKGTKLDKSIMESDMDASFTGGTLSSMIVDDKRIKLSTIAPTHVLESIRAEAESVMGLTYDEIANLKTDLSFHPCLLQLIKKWPIFNLRKMQLAILLEYMLRFHQLPIKSIRNKTPLTACPETTIQFLLASYTIKVHTENKKPMLQINRNEKDKLLFAIMALFAYISDYEFPLEHFMVDVKCARDRLKKLGQLVDMRAILIHKEGFIKAQRPFILEDQ